MPNYIARAIVKVKVKHRPFFSSIGRYVFNEIGIRRNVKRLYLRPRVYIDLPDYNRVKTFVAYLCPARTLMQKKDIAVLAINYFSRPTRFGTISVPKTLHYSINSRTFPHECEKRKTRIISRLINHYARHARLHFQLRISHI